MLLGFAGPTISRTLTSRSPPCPGGTWLLSSPYRDRARSVPTRRIRMIDCTSNKWSNSLTVGHKFVGPKSALCCLGEKPLGYGVPQSGMGREASRRSEWEYANVTLMRFRAYATLRMMRTRLSPLSVKKIAPSCATAKAAGRLNVLPPSSVLIHFA